MLVCVCVCVLHMTPAAQTVSSIFMNPRGRARRAIVRAAVAWPAGSPRATRRGPLPSTGGGSGGERGWCVASHPHTQQGAGSVLPELPGLTSIFPSDGLFVLSFFSFSFPSFALYVCLFVCSLSFFLSLCAAYSFTLGCAPQ